MFQDLQVVTGEERSGRHQKIWWRTGDDTLISLLQFRDERKQKGNGKKKTVLQHRGT